MARGWQIFLGGLALLAGGLGLRAEDWPVTGVVSGQLKLDVLPELGLGWAVTLEKGGLGLRATRPGVKLNVSAAWPGADGVWKWKVEQGEADVAELWPMLRELAGEAAAGWSASGRLEISGEGAWSPEAGPTGEVRLALREGWARSDELGVEVSGAELELATRDLTGETIPAGQRLRVGKISSGNVLVTHVAAEFGLGNGRLLQVAGLSADVLGGQVKLKPFSVPLERPAVSAAAEVQGVDLREVAAMVPWAVAAADGSLGGRIKLDWDEVKGLRIQDGGLKIVKTDAAEFRLAPSPGFLTGSMPKRFTFLPPKLGKWTSRVGPLNPAYAPLREIEMGEVGLRIEEMVVEFRPDGSMGDRTATVRVLARPTKTEFVDKLTIEVNFHGALADALALGLDERVKLNWR